MAILRIALTLAAVFSAAVAPRAMAQQPAGKPTQPDLAPGDTAAPAAGAPDAGKPAGPPALDVSKMSFGPEAVKKVVAYHHPEVQSCYERALADGVHTSGEVMVSLTITPDGIVDKPHTKASSLKNPPIEDCIIDAVRTWYFPKPPQAQPIELPFHFSEVGAPKNLPPAPKPEGKAAAKKKGKKK